MKVKGTAVKSIKEFVKDEFTDDYQNWLDSLTEESRKIHTEPILASNFYSLIDAILKPTEAVAVLFYKGDTEKAAYDMGKYSGLKALKSVYKIFVKVSSLDFVLRRVTSIYSTYYDSGKLFMTERTNDIAKFSILGLSVDEKLNIHRISGWAEALFTVISKTPKSVVPHIVKVDGNFFEGEILISWE